jgi:hypothetical protein
LDWLLQVSGMKSSSTGRRGFNTGRAYKLPRLRVCDVAALLPLLPSLCTGLAAILLHFAFLFFNMLVTWLLRFPEKERKAIIVMASQKNLPTAAGRHAGKQLMLHNDS